MGYTSKGGTEWEQGTGHNTRRASGTIQELIARPMIIANGSGLAKRTKVKKSAKEGGGRRVGKKRKPKKRGGLLQYPKVTVENISGQVSPTRGRTHERRKTAVRGKQIETFFKCVTTRG